MPVAQSRILSVSRSNGVPARAAVAGPTHLLSITNPASRKIIISQSQASFLHSPSSRLHPNPTISSTGTPIQPPSSNTFSAMANSNDSKVARFFSSPEFAVAGASQDSAKFGYKILAWYTSHNLHVTPINPKTPHITVDSIKLDTVASVKDLPSPETTSLSIVTPPAATKQILADAKAVGVKAVWLQPGTYNQEVLEYARTQFEAGLGGTDGGWGGEGWCVLVDGESGLKAASRL